MVYPRLYTCDLVRAQYSIVSANNDSAMLTMQNLMDGDPNSLYEAGQTSATVVFTLPVARKIRGYGLCNHNLYGGYISLSGLVDGVWQMFDLQRQITTVEDLVIDLGTAQLEATQIQFNIVGLSNIKLGCLSVLADYGYSANGVLTEGAGYGIIELGGPGLGGVPRPQPIGGDTGISMLNSPLGFPQFQRLGSVSLSFIIPFEFMKTGRNELLWRLFNSYYPRRTGLYTNVGYSKGIWYTSTDYALATPFALYCVGSPDQPLAYQIDHAGPRGSGSLFLRTLPYEAIV